MLPSRIGDVDILVANVGGVLYAMRSKCNHMGGPLQKGKLDGNVITCPWHGSKWDVTTGKLVSFATPLPAEPIYKVVIDGDQVFVET